MGQYQEHHLVEEAECSALIWALQTTWSLGYRHVEFKGNSCNIINIINHKLINLRL